MEYKTLEAIENLFKNLLYSSLSILILFTFLFLFYSWITEGGI